MSKATGWTKDSIRFKTECGLVRLDAAEYGNWWEHQGGVRIRAVLFGPYGPGGIWEFFSWNERCGIGSGEDPKKTDIRSCAVRAINEYMKRHPGWLKAQLKRDIEEGMERWRGWPLNRLVAHAENCEHWTAMYGEPLFGKTNAEWKQVIQSFEDFRLSTMAICGLDDNSDLRAA